MKTLSLVLNGAKIRNIAKREQVTNAAIYQRLQADVIRLNQQHGTNLSSKLNDIKTNRDAYRNLIEDRPQPVNTVVTINTNQIAAKLRFNNAQDALNSLTGDMLIGAQLMYNTLNVESTVPSER